MKAVNTAVDLIVAHFGTSRDPGVKVGWSSEELGCALHTRLFVPRDGAGQRELGGWLSENQVRLLMLPCDLQAKLGNSSVSPNVGHLVLKYLCPAVQAVLEDGLKAFVLDVIIGQRKNTPWSVVEASTQLGRGRTATLGSRLNSELQRLEMDLQPCLLPRPIHQGPAWSLQQSQPVPRTYQPHYALQRLHPRPAQVSV